MPLVAETHAVGDCVRAVLMLCMPALAAATTLPCLPGGGRCAAGGWCAAQGPGRQDGSMCPQLQGFERPSWNHLMDESTLVQILLSWWVADIQLLPKACIHVTGAALSWIALCHQQVDRHV